ncbi:MAG: RlmE family RNA methyltransferase [Deltaproteobacteria bacterium]|nr:MAG: RlmE family RNA methyltransferase [Deltaproteobacteria bacterium]
MGYLRKDFYYNAAKKHNFLARSIFKIQEIDKQFQLIKPNLNLLDLGCSPGGWLQYVSKKLGNSGNIVGVDLKAIDKSRFSTSIDFIHGNIFEVGQEISNKGLFDLILSDISSKLTGISCADLYNNFCLNREVISIGLKNLKIGGNLCMKMFESAKTRQLLCFCRLYFQTVRQLRLKSTRRESAEIYLIALNRII